MTSDKNMIHQQSLSKRYVAVVVLPTNRKRPVLTQANAIADTIRQTQLGEHVIMTAGGERLVASYSEGALVRRAMPPVGPFET